MTWRYSILQEARQRHAALAVWIKARGAQALITRKQAHASDKASDALVAQIAYAHRLMRVREQLQVRTRERPSSL